MPALFVSILSFLKGIKQSSIVIVLAALASLTITAYRILDARVTRLEFNELSVGEKLNTLNEGQVRIERGVETTRSDIGVLKNLLINRK